MLKESDTVIEYLKKKGIRIKIYSYVKELVKKIKESLVLIENEWTIDTKSV